jgi:hypothetical protein
MAMAQEAYLKRAMLNKRNTVSKILFRARDFDKNSLRCRDLQHQWVSEFVEHPKISPTQKRPI